jgi:hypothetical protein
MERRYAFRVETVIPNERSEEESADLHANRFIRGISPR